MKMIRNIMVGLLVAAATVLSAQTADQTYTVTGEIAVRYNTRTQVDANGAVPAGVTDKYALDINVANSAKMHGTIEFLPFIKNTFSSNQDSQLSYLIECDVLNPKNPAQAKNVGRVFGIVPIDANNVYRFDDGTLKTAIFPIGTAKGFESSFKGTALGKPPVSSGGVFAKLKKEALNVTKMVKGKAVTIPVANYDRVDFQKVVLGSGPVQIYPEAVFNGALIYDYGRTAWYFENVTVSYVIDGRQYQDKLSGNIRWIESPMRATNGEGSYEFDIRVNEPAQSEVAAFAAPADEADFFATDNTIPALTGTMKYKDMMQRDRVASSTINVALTSNKLTKQQVMYLSKMLFLVVVVPLNAE